MENEEIKSEEELAIIEDYDDHREENSRKEEEAIQLAVKSLEPLVQSNLAYLKYAQAQHWFEMTTEEEKIRALHNALTTVISRAINFEIAQAKKIAFRILQDVNDHYEARKVAQVLGLQLKPYELE